MILVSLNLSRNENKLELYLTEINKFKTLKSLDLSHNKIDIPRTNQFNELVELTFLGLRYL